MKNISKFSEKFQDFFSHVFETLEANEWGVKKVSPDVSTIFVELKDFRTFSAKLELGRNKIYYSDDNGYATTLKTNLDIFLTFRDNLMEWMNGDVWYHGTNVDLEEVSYLKISGRFANQAMGPGFYCSRFPTVSRGYGKILYKVTLDRKYSKYPKVPTFAKALKFLAKYANEWGFYKDNYDMANPSMGFLSQCLAESWSSKITMVEVYTTLRVLTNMGNDSEVEEFAKLFSTFFKIDIIHHEESNPNMIVLDTSIIKLEKIEG